jgi:peptidoglycan hydrolase-like protein with peptidoglycan-binding domain
MTFHHRHWFGGTLAALALVPMTALAQADSPRPGDMDRAPPQTDSQADNASDYAADYNNPASDYAASDNAASDNAASRETTGATEARHGQIDPAQVQRVFGRDATSIGLQSLDEQQIRDVQQRLQEMGHYQGQVDGIVGPKTRAALSAVVRAQFLLSQRLVAQDELPPFLLSSLGMSETDRVPTSGRSGDERSIDPRAPQADPSDREGRQAEPARQERPGGTVTPPERVEEPSPNL